MQSSNLNLDSRTSLENMTVQTRVLVVDDDRETTDLLRIILEPNIFEVITTTSGEEGIQMARQLEPDIMLVDLLMPGMDGLKVCKEVRKFSSVPIIVLSAVSKPGIVTKALDEGADDYLIKPMQQNVLIASVKKLTRRARAELEATKENCASRKM